MLFLSEPALHARSDNPVQETAPLGTWFGDFVAATPDGKLSHDTAVLILRRQGSVFSGSIGRTIDQQTAFTNAAFDGHRASFHLDVAGGLSFVLTLSGGRFVGTAVGERIKATISLKPAPGLMPTPMLVEEITAADRGLYDAFTACDVGRYSEFLSKDLEFYHDRTGKTDYGENVAAVRNRCAEGIQLRRELEQSSVIVNAVPGVGAVEAGTHRFYSRNKDGSEHLDATARFTNIWSKDTGSWKLVRVISYDHH
ncbi:MAG: nuclear transport factor 2 family protein [Acidobacteriaceae bacterium]|nr:nuclear transport factor 2 family protein [Acidobacteriaceae bacterium]